MLASGWDGQTAALSSYTKIDALDCKTKCVFIVFLQVVCITLTIQLIDLLTTSKII